MKNIIYPILVIFLYSNSCIAQQKVIEGIMGIKFGATKATVSAVVKQRGGVLIPNNTVATHISYSKVRFGNRTPFMISFGFVNNKMYEVRVFYKVEDSPKILDLYDALLNDILEVYGESSRSERDYKYPFKEGDPEAWLAIQGGYTTISDIWEDDKGSAIKLYIMEKEELISIWYQHHDLYEEAKKQKTNKSDY